MSSQKKYNIPTQKLNLYELTGVTSKPDFLQEVKSFQITEFITYQDYKEYLTAIKKDSTEDFYLSQLPDKNFAPQEIRNKYINSDKYDEYPVLGISWDNAMNYCRWKTLKEATTEIDFVYRLPRISEWLATYAFFLDNNIENDLNDNYSEWLLNNKFNLTLGSENVNKEFTLDIFRIHSADDPITLKRKLVIGNSYLFQHKKLMHFFGWSYYATEGYRHIGFRIVKVPAEDNLYLLNHWGLKNE